MQATRTFDETETPGCLTPIALKSQRYDTDLPVLLSIMVHKEMEDGSDYIGTLNLMTQLQHGHGTQHFIDNSKYVGEYINGMFDGNGKYMY